MLIEHWKGRCTKTVLLRRWWWHCKWTWTAHVDGKKRILNEWTSLVKTRTHTFFSPELLMLFILHVYTLPFLPDLRLHWLENNIQMLRFEINDMGHLEYHIHLHSKKANLLNMTLQFSVIDGTCEIYIYIERK